MGTFGKLKLGLFFVCSILFNSHKKRPISEPTKINPLIIAFYAHETRCGGHASAPIGPTYQNNHPIGERGLARTRMGARAAMRASSNGAVIA
jgi:hypothetical protein